MKLLQNLIILSLITFPVIGSSDSYVKKEKNKYLKNVEDQKKVDEKNRKEIMRKYFMFKNDINKRLKFGNNKTRIDIPIDKDKITDIDDKKHRDSFKPVKKIYAYINDDNVNIRAAGSLKEKVIEKGYFSNRVEILAQSKGFDTIQGIKSRWVLIRKENRNEGWIFGSFLSKTKPKRKATIEDKKKSGKISKRGFMVPTPGRISSNFGYRVHPITKRKGSFHRGLDIVARAGTPIKAAASGVVRTSNYNRGGYGNLIIIQHEKNLATYYAHQSRRVARKGQRVKRGQLIGYVGSTGRSTGPHLHFEIRRGRTALNPNSYLR